MRFKKRFKLLKLQRKNRTIDVPLKILKFGHTRWNSIVHFLKNRKRLAYFFRVPSKKNFQKTKNRKLKLSDNILKKTENMDIIKKLGFTNMKTQSSLKKWERLNEIHKEALNIRRSFYQTYGSHIRYKELKKQLFPGKRAIQDRATFLKKILKFEFRIDILLHRLRFFKSSFETRTYLNKKLIKVNSRAVKGNYYLRAGDIITCDCLISYKENLASLKTAFLLRNCFEIDYYTGTIVVLRSFDEIYESEFPFFFIKYLDMQKFRYSLK